MANSKIVYSYHDVTGEYIQHAIAWESPLEPGIYYMPSYTTEIPPNLQPGTISRWNGQTWINEDIIMPPEPPKPTLEEQIKILRDTLIFIRNTYLSLTDRYALQEIDEPGTYPKEIKSRRIEARGEIRRIKKMTSLSELQKFSIDFN